MPEIHRISEPEFTLAVWKVTENESELKGKVSLSVSDQELLEKLTVPRRRKEFLVARQLLQLISGRETVPVVYDEFGKPHLEDKTHHISISHSRDLVAVMVSESLSVGIDIEKPEERIFKIAHKFVSEAEFKFLGHPSSLQDLYLIWCAKESMFKLYGKGDLDFKEHMWVAPFKSENQGTIMAGISLPNLSFEFNLHYKIHPNWVLVYVSA